MELQLPSNLTEITNIFYYYKDKANDWKQSKNPLFIYDNDKLVAEIASWDTIKKNSYVYQSIQKYLPDVWLPTYKLYKNNMFKLYDERFQKTHQGIIPIEGEPKPIDYKKLMGDIGEEIITDLCPNAVLSDDDFDMEKDGNISDIIFEVKTSTLNRKSQSFWMEESQWKKLDGCDIFFIVSVPWLKTDPCEVFQVTNHLKNHTTFFYNGKNLRAYPLTKCLKVGSIEDDRAQKLYDYSLKISAYKRKVLFDD